MEVNSIVVTQTYTMKADGFEIYVTDLQELYSLVIMSSGSVWAKDVYPHNKSGRKALLSAIEVLDFNAHGFIDWVVRT